MVFVKEIVLAVGTSVQTYLALLCAKKRPPFIRTVTASGSIGVLRGHDLVVGDVFGHICEEYRRGKVGTTGELCREVIKQLVVLE